jgi:hypothetical protein
MSPHSPSSPDHGSDTGAQVPRSVRLGGLGDVIAAIPFLLTYVPADAVVMMAFAGARLLTTACLSFLAPEDVGPQVRRLNHLLTHGIPDSFDGGVTHVVVVGYGTDRIDPVLTGMAEALVVPVEAVARVEDGRWWCLTCHDPACCPPGAPVEASDAVRLALLVGAGVPAPDRSGRAADLRPASKELVGRVAEVLSGRTGAVTLIDPWRKFALLTAAKRARAQKTATGLGPYAAAVMLLALADVRVRDACVTWHDDGAVRLWRDLVRAAPPGWVAPAATLLALAAYRGGDGVLANLAIDRALDDDPRYPLAGLVRDMLALGIPPERLTADLQAIADQVLLPLTRTATGRRIPPQDPDTGTGTRTGNDSEQGSS